MGDKGAAPLAGVRVLEVSLLGAGAGSVVLGALTHSPAGWVGGAVLGGIAGHSIATDNCRDEHRHYRRGYYDSHHRWHYYG